MMGKYYNLIQKKLRDVQRSACLLKEIKDRRLETHFNAQDMQKQDYLKKNNNKINSSCSEFPGPSPMKKESIF